MATPRTGRPRGRPRIQETADRVVADALARAGRRIDGPAWSSRALAERTGLSQTAVSRAVRRLAGEEAHSGIAADAVGGAAGGRGSPEGDAGVPTVLRSAVIDAEGCRVVFEPVPGDDGPGGGSHRDGAAERVGQSVRGAQGSRDERNRPGAQGRGRHAGMQGAPRASGTGQRRRAALMGALVVMGIRHPPDLAVRLAGCEEIPLDLLDALAAHVEAGRAEFSWEAEVPRAVGRHREGAPVSDSSLGAAAHEVPRQVGVPGRNAASGQDAGSERDAATGLDSGSGREAGSDSEPARSSPEAPSSGSGPARRRARERAWLPRSGTSATEQLAVRLRDAIIDTGLRPGDRLSAARTAELLEVPRSKAAEVLRRMVDDEILDGSAGDVRIPQASADDVIELYAARMLLGDVLLRAAAHRPRRYLLPARRALDAVARGAASGEHVDDADLRFQQEWARASGLEQTVRLFESSTVRVRMLIAVLRLDYARTAASILRDDRAILTALAAGDPRAAVHAWHRKIDAAVRHMHGRARSTAFDVQLWSRLTGL